MPRVDDDGGDDDDDDDLLLRSWRLEEPPRYFSRSQTGCRSPKVDDLSHTEKGPFPDPEHCQHLHDPPPPPDNHQVHIRAGSWRGDEEERRKLPRNLFKLL